jgi:serine O-acetyltransferase
MLPMAIFRVAHALHRAHVPVLPRVLCGINRIVFAMVLPASARVGRDVLFGYQGLGVVVHADAVIGDRVVLATGVTIGGTGTQQGVPVIEDDVYIGSGAKLLGPIRIGRGSRIGANAVVLMDVPAGAIAVGVPARVIPGAAGGQRS